MEPVYAPNSIFDPQSTAAICAPSRGPLQRTDFRQQFLQEPEDPGVAQAQAYRRAAEAADRAPRPVFDRPLAATPASGAEVADLARKVALLEAANKVLREQIDAGASYSGVAT